MLATMEVLSGRIGCISAGVNRSDAAHQLQGFFEDTPADKVVLADSFAGKFESALPIKDGAYLAGFVGVVDEGEVQYLRGFHQGAVVGCAQRCGFGTVSHFVDEFPGFAGFAQFIIGFGCGQYHFSIAYIAEVDVSCVQFLIA